jgi:DNA-binding winged helix-turn-helix (wHTH) protein
MELTHEADVLRAGDLEVWPADHLALAKGRALPLSLREVELLGALVRRRGRIVSREELYATVWGAPLRADDRSVDVYVHKLRSKLARAVPGCAFIHTHFGLGYRFEPEESAAFGGKAEPSADFGGKHRHSAASGGKHRLSHPFHRGSHQPEQDGYR